MKLWRSGIIWSVLSFVGGLGNLAFSALIGHRMAGEYADMSSLLNFIQLLSIPITIVTTALVHYIAHFRGQNDEARLQGLLAGCQNFLLKATVAGSILTVLVVPVGSFFNFRTSQMLAALICVLVGLWAGFAAALCQGMAWFKRLAVIGLVAVVMRIAFGWFVTVYKPTAEMAASATTFSLLANLGLLYWWKTIFQHGAVRISPWNREFVNFLVVTAAYVAGYYFFLSGDALVAKRYFGDEDNLAYQTAGTLARALPSTVTPLLLVLFTSRSNSKKGQAVTDQRVLLSLAAGGLMFGALCLIVFRDLWVRIILKHSNPAAAQMLVPLSITMVFGGLGQAIGIWSLASRWLKTAMVYGALGIGYWGILLIVGRTPAALLRIMPIAAGAAFAVLCLAWLATLRRRTSRAMPA